MTNRFHRANRLLVIGLLTLLVGAVTVSSEGKQEAGLIISAAVSLQAPLETIRQLYEKENPHVKLTLNFGSSGALRQQIEEGAPADVFFPAAAREMDQPQAKGLILERTRLALLKNRMVLIASKKSRWIKRFQDLTSPRLSQIALGQPESVPAGMYAREVLAYLGIWEQVRPKVVYGKDVKQVFTWVATGNIEAGFVYATDARNSTAVKVIATAPELSHSPIVYPVAVVKTTQYLDEAKRFVRYLSSAKAQRVFNQYGFTTNNSQSAAKE